MNGSEFITVLSETYGEPMIKEGKPNIKLKFIKKWLEENFDNQKLDQICERVIKRFIPTSVNPCPLIPHIVEICELETSEKSKAELARVIADRVINAVMTIGTNEQGCTARATEIVGELGMTIVKETFGSWYHLGQLFDDTAIGTLRAQLRDSALAYINRAEKGIENEVPKLEDARVKRMAITGEPVNIKEAIKKLEVLHETTGKVNGNEK